MPICSTASRNLVHASVAISLVLCCTAVEAADQPAPGSDRRDRFGDALPSGALYRIGTLRLQHGAEVRSLAASPDGKFLASAANDRRLSVWEIATGREARRLRLDSDPVGWVAFTPDSKSLLVNKAVQSSATTDLCLVDIATGMVRKVLPGVAHAGVIAAGGTTMITLQDRGGVIWSPTICRWDLASGKLLKEWRYAPEPPPHDGGGAGLRGGNFEVRAWLSADGALLATIETDRSRPDKEKQTLRLHDVATGKELRRWPVTAPHVTDLVFSNDRKFVILGCANSAHRVFDVATAQEVRRWQAEALRDDFSFGDFRLAMAPDGDSVFSAGIGGLTRWDWRTGKKLHTYRRTFAPIAFLNGGKAIAAQGYTNSVYVLDAATGKDLTPFPRPGSYLGFSPDGRRIAWSERGDVVIGNATTGAVERRWPSGGHSVGRLVFSPDGTTLAVSAGGDKHVRLWDVKTAKEIHALPHEHVMGIYFSPDGKRLATEADDIRVWDLTTGERRGEWQGTYRAACDPNLRIIAVNDRKANSLRLIDMASGKLAHALPGYQERISCYYEQKHGSASSAGNFTPLFSPNGRVLLAGCAAANGDPAGFVQFWDVATGKRLPTTLDGKKFVLDLLTYHLAFSPDSRLLAVSRRDCALCLVRAATGAVLRTLGPADEPMTATPVFTPDGRTLLTAVKGLVQVWEVATGGELCRRTGHQGDIDTLEMAGDGRTAASVAGDHTTLVWDLAHLASGANLPVADCWAELANRNAATARRAIESLTAAPADALTLLRKHLAPVPAVGAKQLARWIADLGDDDFDKRQQAYAALDRLGESAGAQLRQALAAGPPLEAKRRMEELLRQHDPDVLPPEALRVLRAVQVLEMIGSPAARELLQSFASGAAGAHLTREARGALGRLANRRSGA